MGKCFCSDGGTHGEKGLVQEGLDVDWIPLLNKALSLTMLIVYTCFVD